jgi:hypothetical protein
MDKNDYRRRKRAFLIVSEGMVVDRFADIVSKITHGIDILIFKIFPHPLIEDVEIHSLERIILI